jgi:L-aspartate oxidase
MERPAFLVIGTGIAGLTFALKAARLGPVLVVTKSDPAETNTSMAQGGIASVLDPSDSFDLHVQDTLACGAGLCRREVVETVVREGPDRVQELVEWGVDFSREGERFALGREGGHSRNRIVHSADLTGREIERVLLQRVLEHPGIELRPYQLAVNLILRRHLEDPSLGASRTVYGAYLLDQETERIEAVQAAVTVLATGGAGKVYLYTSNPDVATGDGLAMAYRAGARLANLEFVQFHPTCLYHPRAKSFLLSEALRGEGGVLRRRDGEAFMKRYHPQADLAPRDVVARAIDQEMKRTGDKCVYLDMTHLGADRLRERFPNLYEKCLEFGYDMAAEPVPVVPATHYFCGGVDVDRWGRTSLDRLFALGEVSHTGLHGANRLASNSLLEALVFAHRAVEYLAEHREWTREPVPRARPWESEGTEELRDSVILDHDWDTARRVMWDYVGIVRSDLRLHIAKERLNQIRRTVEYLYWRYRLTRDLVELRNLVLVGELIVRCALRRRESRGLHYTTSWPRRDDRRFRRATVIEGPDGEFVEDGVDYGMV